MTIFRVVTMAGYAFLLWGSFPSLGVSQTLAEFTQAFRREAACTGLQKHLVSKGFLKATGADGDCRDGTKSALDQYLGSLRIPGPDFVPASNYVDRLLIEVTPTPAPEQGPEIVDADSPPVEPAMPGTEPVVVSDPQNGEIPANQAVTEAAKTAGVMSPEPASSAATGAPPPNTATKVAPAPALSVQVVPAAGSEEEPALTDNSSSVPQPRSGGIGGLLSGISLSDVLAVLATVASVIGLTLRERRNISKEITQKIEASLSTQGKDKEKFERDIARVKKIIDARSEELDDQIRDNRLASKEHAANAEAFENRVSVLNEKLEMISARESFEEQITGLKTEMEKATTTFKELVSETHEQIQQALEKADEANQRVECLREEVANVVKLPGTARA